MALFIAALWIAFRYVGRVLLSQESNDVTTSKLAWALGAALFAQAASGVSVSYFDQSFIFLFMNLALINSLYSSAVRPVQLEPSSMVDTSTADVIQSTAIRSSRLPVIGAN